MRNRSPSPEHAEAVSRRLATLSAELAAVRGDPPDPSSPAAPPPGPSEEHAPTRVRPGRLDPWVADGPAEPPAPVTLPTPGRHAARRLVDRVRLGPAHLAVLALVVAVGLAVTAWLVIRSSAQPVPLPEVEPASAPLTAVGDAGAAPSVPDASGLPVQEAGGVTGGAAEATGEVTVDVAGKVRRPGIAVLPAGSRVVDAIEAAGGARPGVDLTSLNLARLLVDGEQVLVGVPAAPGAAAATSPGAVPGQGPLVDLNTADEVALETLPGVGPVTAAAIISWRTEHGGFTAVDELLEVDGIGDATLAEIAPHVTV